MRYSGIIKSGFIVFPQVILTMEENVEYRDNTEFISTEAERIARRKLDAACGSNSCWPPNICFFSLSHFLTPWS